MISKEEYRKMHKQDQTILKIGLVAAIALLGAWGVLVYILLTEILL